MFTRVLIFGGTGSLGTTIVKSWQNKVDQFIIFSRSEQTQWLLKQTFPTINFSFVLGDISNKDKVHQTILQYRPTLIIVASAMKHIERCQRDIRSCLNTNSLGLMNVIESVQQLREIDPQFCLKKVVMVSTDKACSPVNVYGMSKSICEQIIENTEIPDVTLVCVRYGNVINSNGSIIPVLMKQALDDKVTHFTLTDDRMTRFYMTLENAVDLIDDCVNYGGNGQIWIPELSSMKILDLITLFRDKYNKPIKIVGLRPGEKIHESLISETEILRTRKNNTGYNRYVIYPERDIPTLPPVDPEKDYPCGPCGPCGPLEYSSRDCVIDQKDLAERLEKYLGVNLVKNDLPVIVILGSDGMLGRYLCTYFTRAGYPVINYGRKDLVVTEQVCEKLGKYIGLVHPYAKITVINCIGKTNKSNASRDDFFLVNSRFSHALYNLCRERDWNYIYPSTDCVFDGKLSTRTSYTEEDEPNCVDDYGQSKYAGECGTVIRVSIIGKELKTRRGLYENVIQGKISQGYTNHFWNGITCLEYAKILEQILQKNLFWEGVRHISPCYKVSKYTLIENIFLTHRLLISEMPKPYQTDETINRCLSTIHSLDVKINDLTTQLTELEKFEL